MLLALTVVSRAPPRPRGGVLLALTAVSCAPPRARGGVLLALTVVSRAPPRARVDLLDGVAQPLSIVSLLFVELVLQHLLVVFLPLKSSWAWCLPSPRTHHLHGHTSLGSSSCWPSPMHVSPLPSASSLQNTQG